MGRPCALCRGKVLGSKPTGQCNYVLGWDRGGGSLSKTLYSPLLGSSESVNRKLLGLVDRNAPGNKGWSYCFFFFSFIKILIVIGIRSLKFVCILEAN